MSKKGLTAIEVLTIVAFIAILLAIVIPSLNRAKQAAREQAGQPAAAPIVLDLAELPQGDRPAPEPDSVGLFFCLDISGSMAEKLGAKKKIDVSKDAMRVVFKQIDKYVKENPNRKVSVGVCAFSSIPMIVHPLAPFDLQALEASIVALKPTSSTAIGDATRLALVELMRANTETKAILIMTDGANNVGLKPGEVVQAIKQDSNSRKLMTAGVEVFLVAFDIEGAMFAPVKAAGATVMESRDAASLQNIMTTLVEEVLLEAP